MIHHERNAIFLLLLFSIFSFSCQEQGEYLKFYRMPKSTTLASFKEAKTKISATDKDHLAFWHSMLTGNTRALSRPYQLKYKKLGLSHIFTPSGFHLSSVLVPLRFILPSKIIPPLLILISLLIFQLPGQEALKRMSLVKVIQNYLGTKGGFYTAMGICFLMGQLNSSPLSFIFSLFFLGLIFSNLKGITLVIWFFIGQLLITLLNGGSISPLNLLFSPIANTALTLITPFLFALSFPLSGWQLDTGIFIIKFFDHLIQFLYQVTTHFPVIEVHFFTIVILFFTLWRMKKLALISFCIFSFSLNTERATPIKASRYYFEPQGELTKVISKDGNQNFYYQDGVCRVRLRMGIWEKRCSPKRAPHKIKSLKKLSYL